MNILFLIRSLDYGGAERQLVLLAKGLRERGHGITVALFYSGGPLEEDLKAVGVKIRPLQKRGRWDLLAFLLRLAQAIREERPNIVHGYLRDPNSFSVFLKPLFPEIKFVWGVRSSMMDESQYDWGARLSSKMSCIMSKFADAIIANSRAGREHHIVMGYPADKTIVIPNGIDTDRFTIDPIARVRLRSEWRVPDHDRLIGLVGRLDPMKDHANFLKAAALLVKEKQRVRFVCVGDGPAKYRETLEEMARALGLADRMMWVNARQDVTAVYNALDLLVSSSLYGEGFSNVLGEAMACGVPCVVTDVGDSAWVVGGLGEVVPSGNPAALADSIMRMVKEKSHEPAQIRRRIVNEFSVARLVANTEEELGKLVHK